MTQKCARNTAKFLFLTAAMISLSGCIITPRVAMTERIDFNYHAPAIMAPLSPAEQLCQA